MAVSAAIYVPIIKNWVDEQNKQEYWCPACNHVYTPHEQKEASICIIGMLILIVIISFFPTFVKIKKLIIKKFK